VIQLKEKERQEKKRREKKSLFSHLLELILVA